MAVLGPSMNEQIEYLSVCLKGFDAEKYTTLRVRITDNDGAGNKVAFPLLSISINGSEEYIGSRDHFVEMFDEVLSKAGEQYGR